jgi:hypothetical protein
MAAKNQRDVAGLLQRPITETGIRGTSTIQKPTAASHHLNEACSRCTNAQAVVD